MGETAAGTELRGKPGAQLRTSEEGCAYYIQAVGYTSLEFRFGLKVKTGGTGGTESHGSRYSWSFSLQIQIKAERKREGREGKEETRKRRRREGRRREVKKTSQNE